MDELREKGLNPLRLILGFTLLSTTLHYAQNVISAASYPPVAGISLGVTQFLVAFTWVLTTACGALGYRAYRRGRYWPSLAFLLVYSLSGIGSAGHFLVGVPQVPAFWFATIFTDVFASLLLWLFVAWAASKLNRVISGDQVST
ncbi:hypothetical protein [Amycolatopsis sp. H20-H5]|uniref:hypothetical protein n=1 Tax=Amycolatopsis sp. H20-H5 TaxID=3046309 RepID=UPI002DBE0D0C|nr:hypothetical protein [Amycolatopsis sp. H20-H5]MEC3979940.1 hypothetical protein [Amycolatopsis sp. H20-H5]